jgi:hypothetical protein
MDSFAQTHTWYTGDWKTYPIATQAPYNGVAITAVAHYNNPGVPGAVQQLVSVDLQIVDYTNEKEGAATSLNLSLMDTWYAIPPPDAAVPVTDPTLQVPAIPDPAAVTVLSGKVKLDTTSNGMYLNVEFCYGITGRVRGELGYIMKIDRVFQDGQDPIRVEA